MSAPELVAPPKLESASPVGTLVSVNVGQPKDVPWQGRTVFTGLASPMTATRYHSLIVEESSLPKELEISATTHDADGTRVIMGLRHKKYPVEGVQFHPESVLTPDGAKLIRNFLQ